MLKANSAIATLVGLVLLTACGGGQSSSNSTSNQPINVGAMFPLTGPHGPAGQAFLAGIQLAAIQINNAGGVMGRKLNVVPKNTNGDPVDAVTAVRQMLAADNPSVVIGFSGGDYQDALPILNQAKVVTLTDVGDPVLDHQVMPYSFRAVPSDALEGTAMAWWASHEGWNRVALVFDADTASQTLVPSIQAAASSLPLTIVASNSSDLPTGTPSYQTQVQAIIATHPQAVLTQVVENDAGTFYSEWRNLGGGSIPVIGSDTTSTGAWVKAFGSAQAQNELVSVVPSTSTSAAGAQFVAAYTSQFNSPPRSLSANDYDALIVASLAMIAAHSTDPSVYYRSIPAVTTPGPGVTVVTSFSDGAKLLAAGKKIKYEGISSPMTFDPTYHTLAVPFQAVKTNDQGGITVIGEIPAEALAAI